MPALFRDPSTDAIGVAAIASRRRRRPPLDAGALQCHRRPRRRPRRRRRCCARRRAPLQPLQPPPPRRRSAAPSCGLPSPLAIAERIAARPTTSRLQPSDWPRMRGGAVCRMKHVRITGRIGVKW